MEYGKAKVVSGKIIVTDPSENGRYATITPASKGVLLVNGEVAKTKVKVKSSDKIEYQFDEIQCSRNIKVDISQDKMQAYLTIEYTYGEKNQIVDCDLQDELLLEVKQEKVKPETFTKEDINKALHNQGIEYGIKEDAIAKIKEYEEVNGLLIAQGKMYKDAIDDEFEFKNEENNSNDNESQAIDYKNLNKINSVLVDEVVGTIKQGKDAEEGINLLGKAVKSKKNKRKYIKNGNGCKIMSDNIIATINGQASLKNGIVSVHNVYSLEKDVDMTTGNINFKGDIYIPGNVNDGMKVTALNDIHIAGNVFGSAVLSKGDVLIEGSVINSRVIVGGNDITKQNRLKILETFKENLESIYESVKYLFENKILKGNANVAEVIRNLIDTKYKDFRKISIEVISIAIKDNDSGSLVVKRIKQKMMPSSIKEIVSLDEIEEMIQLVDEEIDVLKDEEAKCSEININYCQESVLQSSGDIIVNGKGMFSTELHSLHSIIFKNKAAICRGGVLKAGKGIVASTIGSEAAAQTILEVDDKMGTITIEVAYANTLIIINKRKKMINVPCKHVKCYIDKTGELVIDKLLL